MTDSWSISIACFIGSSCSISIIYTSQITMCLWSRLQPRSCRAILTVMKLFVWDFHGVLEVGTEDTVYEISNQVLADFGYAERFSKKQNHDLFGRKWFEYYEYLLPDQPHDRHLALQQASFDMSDSRPDLMAKHVRPNVHATDVLSAIAQTHQQIIISNTKPSSLGLFITAA